ncbi:hypothetical protein ACSCBZ_42520 [Streptomyces niveiscabiei]|uniref:hypothetical protein n=1 Tax=Streptomyces niveiscabiei TaxID=164115 RepID=UPI0006EBB2D9|nr:hypothetical protein [Streptomyces niveiscabiei]
MTDTPPPRSGAGRVPDWWLTKTPELPDENTLDGADDWWDALYDAPDTSDENTPVVEPESAEAEPETASSAWLIPQPDYYPSPHAPVFITQAPARIALSGKTRAGLYNASAAGAGWALGLYDPLAAALADCGHDSTGGALVLGFGTCLLIAETWDRRTRHWWPGIAWAARIPLATAVLALALWAPAAP